MYRMRCKPWTQAAILFSILWSPFTLFGIWDFISCGRVLSDPNAIVDYCIWLIHLLLIAIAVVLSYREREKAALCISDEAINLVVGHGILVAVLSSLPIPVSIAIHFAVHILFKKAREKFADDGNIPWYAREMSPRTARNLYGELLRNFAAGVIDVDDFEESEASLRSKADPADARLLADARMLAWSHYDDIFTDRLRGHWKLSKEARVVFARMIMFLKTDQSYQWTDRQLDGLDATSPRCVWPFVDVDEYRIALRHPRLLAGSVPDCGRGGYKIKNAARSYFVLGDSRNSSMDNHVFGFIIRAPLLRNGPRMP